ncbi:hypothetical protein GCK72_023290 [Caenorhabditis remanei]|uniref:Enoyl-CoA hydratase/isomerase family protein n=1 Tax=Caenorhabditis remanei TaxID=31234 RepID=E3MAW4_CAERE|nr:hypothetical protein GCK72_023290 [Caenorhabditis remanei]EFO97336.1 hypothetical protein CRE_16644 [Caenorhabditis remanei]KAF1746832.1 hypothetical protein GCK72_023290 [Caenorhabditis remanei]
MEDNLILSERKENVLWVTLNRPKKFNALTRVMFLELCRIFKEAADDDEIAFVVFTGGKGKYYCAGSDFSPAELATLHEIEHHGYKLFVDVLIDFPKPVIALVNGHAVGVSVTMLGVMDAVIAIDTATFQTPFADIGVCPEACSSYTLPRIMGHQKAAALMMFSEKFTAQEAYTAGLVTKILPAATFEEDSKKVIARYATLSPFTMQVGKKLMRTTDIQDALLTVNRKEEVELNGMFSREDTIARLTAKFVKPSKI